MVSDGGGRDEDDKEMVGDGMEMEWGWYGDGKTVKNVASIVKKTAFYFFNKQRTSTTTFCLNFFCEYLCGK